MPVRRLWGALGTPNAVRLISVCMLIYLIIIGGLTYGYARVSGCLARYADESANSTAARANAAAEDRGLDSAERRVDDADRARYRADQVAMSRFLSKITNPSATDEQRKQDFGHLLSVVTDTSTILDANEVERERIRAERARIEQERRQNPVPPPPSETC